MLRTIKPKLLVLYGSKTINAFNKRYENNIHQKLPLPNEHLIVKKIKYGDWELTVMITEHFARGYSNQKAIDTGKEIIKRMEKLQKEK